MSHLGSNGQKLCRSVQVLLQKRCFLTSRHSNLSLYTPTCFFSSSVPSFLPNSPPDHPSPLFLKFHDLLLTPSTNDLLLFSPSLFFLSISLPLPIRSSEDSAYEEHHCSGRKKHFHKLPCDWLPLLLNQLVQGGASAAWQPSPGGVRFFHFCPKTIKIYQNLCPTQHCLTWIYSMWMHLSYTYTYNSVLYTVHPIHHKEYC